MTRFNAFPMLEWHIQHMEKTILKFITGLSANPSLWEKRQYKRYNNIYRTCGNINNDIKHGVTSEQVQLFLQKLRDDVSFFDLREKEGVIGRLDIMDKHFRSLEIIDK